MAKKEALRELQSRLAQRLQAARLQQIESATWLAVECADQGVLLPLGQAGEIFPLSAVLPVPHTGGWFLGVANLRGRLHGVADLAGFLGLRSAPFGDTGREQARLIALNPALEVNCALLVDRLAGLRSADQLKAAPDEGARPAFGGTRYLDGAGRSWQEIRLKDLAAEEAFLRIAR